MDLVRKLKNALENSGLTDEEIRFYVQTLKTQNSSIFEIAQKAKIHKDKAYKIYNQLENKGLLISSEEGKYKKIKTCSLQGYLEDLYKKGRQFYQAADRLKEVRPFLSFINSEENSSLMKALNTENLASDFVDFAYMDWEKVLVYGNYEIMVDIMGKDPDLEFMKLRLRRGKEALPVLTYAGPYALELIGRDQNEMRRTKIVDCDKFKNSFIMLLPDLDTVAMWSKDNKGFLSGITVKNKILTHLHEETFKYLDSVSDAQFSKKRKITKA